MVPFRYTFIGIVLIVFITATLSVGDFYDRSPLIFWIYEMILFGLMAIGIYLDKFNPKLNLKFPNIVLSVVIFIVYFGLLIAPILYWVWYWLYTHKLSIAWIFALVILIVLLFIEFIVVMSLLGAIIASHHKPGIYRQMGIETQKNLTG